MIANISNTHQNLNELDVILYRLLESLQQWKKLISYGRL